MKTCNSGSDVVGLVLDRTPLYAEQGGQTFDKARVVGFRARIGELFLPGLALLPESKASITCGSVEFSVDNTQKYVPGLHVHFSRDSALATHTACPDAVQPLLYSTSQPTNQACLHASMQPTSKPGRPQHDETCMSLSHSGTCLLILLLTG